MAERNGSKRGFGQAVGGIGLMLALLGWGGCSPPPGPADSSSGPTEVQGSAEKPAAQAVLRVAAASDLQAVFGRLLEQYQRDHASARVEPTFGSSGNFCAQITEGAPYDLFLSANRRYPEELIARKLARPQSLRCYALGRLALWVPRDSSLDLDKLGLAALADPVVRRIALANPRHAPYGQAAEGALRAAGLYDALAPKLVFGESVAQAAQFAESGSADAGLIALPLARAAPLAERGRTWIVPVDAYAPIEQFLVVLQRTAHVEQAESLAAFLLSPVSRQILAEAGFGLPEPVDAP